MTEFASALVLLLLSCLVVSTAAWGAIFEPVKGGFGGILTALKARERDDDEEYQFYRASLENTYLLEYYEEDPAELVRKSLFEASQSLFQDELYAESLELLETECTGDDCDECLIPDEFKTLPGEETIDVMTFLGIRRAEPLRVERKSSDWQ